MIFLFLGGLVGCSDGTPFPMEKISGKVTYEDGSLIPADKIRIIFKTIDVESQGKISPRGAKGSIDPATGQFSILDTWKSGDGVICGRNRVAIIPMEFGKNIDPMGRPNKKVVDPKYFSTRDTPLEIEVVSGGENQFDLVVTRPK